MHTQNDVKYRSSQNQGTVTTAPSGMWTDTPVEDVGRVVRHTLFCLLFMPLAVKPLTKKHVTGTHALCSEVHASTGCVRRDSTGSVVSLPLALLLSFYLLHIVAMFINYCVVQFYKTHIYLVRKESFIPLSSHKERT